jgi:hypothetical protein
MGASTTNKDLVWISQALYRTNSCYQTEYPPQAVPPSYFFTKKQEGPVHQFLSIF